MKATEKPAKVKERAYAFSLDIIRLYQRIKAHNEFVLSRQVLRSGTSIGANMEEASPSRAEKTSVPKCLLPQRKLVKLFTGCLY
jgi:four helix bundle protein